MTKASWTFGGRFQNLKLNETSKYGTKLAEWTGLEPATSCVTGRFRPIIDQFTSCCFYCQSIFNQLLTPLFHSAVESRWAPHKEEPSCTLAVRFCNDLATYPNRKNPMGFCQKRGTFIRHFITAALNFNGGILWGQGTRRSWSP